MKLSIAAIALATFFTQASAAPATSSAPQVSRDHEASDIIANLLTIYRQPATVPNCGYPTLPLLRGWSKTGTDHFYTTNVSEMELAVGGGSYVSQGDAGTVLTWQAPATIPLYRVFHPYWIDHFYTVDAAERDYALTTAGYVDQGIAAYVYPEGECGAVEFYRVYNPVSVDHFYTTDETEKTVAIDTENYVDEGDAGFISPQ